MEIVLLIKSERLIKSQNNSYDDVLEKFIKDIE